MADRVVVSLGDAILRESDVQLLKGPHWLNDRVISFYFEYLHQNKFEHSGKIAFVSPEVSQFLKLVSPEEIPVFLDPLRLEEKEVILLAVNNASDPSQPGAGSHWSLLIFSRQVLEFFHLDSSGGMNEDDARVLARKLHHFLSRATRFQFKFSPVPVIAQTNGYDCGIHLLSHAEHATRHYMVYGNASGLEPLEGGAVKRKREEILKIAMSLSSLPSDSGGGS
jgi:sentrin-specific protease 8